MSPSSPLVTPPKQRFLHLAHLISLTSFSRQPLVSVGFYDALGNRNVGEGDVGVAGDMGFEPAAPTSPSRAQRCALLGFLRHPAS